MSKPWPARFDPPARIVEASQRDGGIEFVIDPVRHDAEERISTNLQTMIKLKFGKDSPVKAELAGGIFGISDPGDKMPVIVTYTPGKRVSREELHEARDKLEATFRLADVHADPEALRRSFDELFRSGEKGYVPSLNPPQFAPPPHVAEYEIDGKDLTLTVGSVPPAHARQIEANVHQAMTKAFGDGGPVRVAAASGNSKDGGLHAFQVTYKMQEGTPRDALRNEMQKMEETLKATGIYANLDSLGRAFYQLYQGSQPTKVAASR